MYILCLRSNKPSNDIRICNTCLHLYITNEIIRFLTVSKVLTDFDLK